MSNIIIVSPHPDDAVFSLGGFMISNNHYQLTIINVFTVSCYTVTGFGNPESITAARMKEERKVSKRLNVKSINLGFRDASLRAPYTCEADYLNPILDVRYDASWPMIDVTVRTAAASNDYEFLLFPLGLGHHVDHRILFEIGKNLLYQGYPVLFYEDGSYDVTRDVKAISAYVAEADLELRRYALGPLNLKEKLGYVKMYRTQVDDYVLSNIIVASQRNGGENVWAKSETAERLVRGALATP